MTKGGTRMRIIVPAIGVTCALCLEHVHYVLNELVTILDTPDLNAEALQILNETRGEITRCTNLKIYKYK